MKACGRAFAGIYRLGTPMSKVGDTTGDFAETIPVWRCLCGNGKKNRCHTTQSFAVCRLTAPLADVFCHICFLCQTVILSAVAPNAFLCSYERFCRKRADGLSAQRHSESVFTGNLSLPARYRRLRKFSNEILGRLWSRWTWLCSTCLGHGCDGALPAAAARFIST